MNIWFSKNVVICINLLVSLSLVLVMLTEGGGNMNRLGSFIPFYSHFHGQHGWTSLVTASRDHFKTEKYAI